MGLSLAFYSSRAEDAPSGLRTPDGLWAICQPWPTAPLAARKSLLPLLRFPERDC